MHNDITESGSHGDIFVWLPFYILGAWGLFWCQGTLCLAPLLHPGSQGDALFGSATMFIAITVVQIYTIYHILKILSFSISHKSRIYIYMNILQYIVVML